jgi:alpha-galactosidase
VGGFAAKGCIGPELGFGWAVGDYLDGQVLLIKFGPGGTSLAGPWRPPSSGGTVGDEYQKMIASVKKKLETLKTDFPGYDGKGHEIVGFGWHQGWNDGCSMKDSQEYEKNMANFIRDVRKDLGVPKLPFVIGGSGFGGWGQTIDRRLMIMKAQAAVAQYDEFKDNVRYVETRGFFRDGDVSPHKFRYHWCGNAETYYLIGDGMGKAMVELLGGPKAPANPTGPSEKK